LPDQVIEVRDAGPVASGPLDFDGTALLDGAGELATAALALARRFAAGGTMWCLAPGAPHHGRHIAVEFVHPVIMGKRSLPAMAVEESNDPVASVRLLVRPGDILVVVGDADDAELGRLLRRGDSWGLLTILLAGGSPPQADLADHVVRVGAIDDGGALLAYHLLWELTHVVFEHPGLLVGPEPVCRDDVCITCSDEGRVVEVVSTLEDATAVVLADGRRESVDTSVVDEVKAGDLLLVHAGLALALIDEPG